MGLPLTAPLSIRTGIPMVIARKRSYGLEGEVEVSQETGYSKGSIYLNDIKEGERIVIMMMFSPPVGQSSPLLKD